jgi:hypothetical protein
VFVLSLKEIETTEDPIESTEGPNRNCDTKYLTQFKLEIAPSPKYFSEKIYYLLDIY